MRHETDTLTRYTKMILNGDIKRRHEKETLKGYMKRKH